MEAFRQLLFRKVWSVCQISRISAKSQSWAFSLYVNSSAQGCDLAPFLGDLTNARTDFLKNATNIVVPTSFSVLVSNVRFPIVQTFMSKYKCQIWFHNPGILDCWGEQTDPLILNPRRIANPFLIAFILKVGPSNTSCYLSYFGAKILFTKDRLS